MRIAVFDLDGTITRRDTFIPYLHGWRSRHRHVGFDGRAIKALVRYLVRHDRGRLKSDLIRACMGGATRADVSLWTAEYVAALGSAELCARALEAIAAHRSDGDRLVLLSASVDLYVPAIGHRLGFDETICTEVAWRDDRLDGGLVTENRRGEEKRRCVELLRARHPGIPVVAYGNAASDFSHFALADTAVLVNARHGLRRNAVKRGYRTEDWHH